MLEERISLINIVLDYLLCMNNVSEGSMKKVDSTDISFVFAIKLTANDLRAMDGTALVAEFVIKILEKIIHMSKNVEFKWAVREAIKTYKKELKETGPHLDVLFKSISKAPAKDIKISYKVRGLEETVRDDVPKSNWREPQLYEISPGNAIQVYTIIVEGTCTSY